jgi:hypothetical protein
MVILLLQNTPQTASKHAWKKVFQKDGQKGGVGVISQNKP